MSVSDRLNDARLLYAKDHREGALLLVLIAVAATSRRRYPKEQCKDPEAFKRFLKDEMVVVANGAPKLYVRVPKERVPKHSDAVYPRNESPSDAEKSDLAAIPIEDFLYVFVRNNLAHEGALPRNISFISGSPDHLTVSISDDKIEVSDTIVDNLAKAVTYAPENHELFPHIAAMPEDVVGWMLFGSERDAFSDYLKSRTNRARALLS